MNMTRFVDVAFEFSTIDPYREMLPEEFINDYENAAFEINKNCTNNGQEYMDAWKDPGKYFNNEAPGGPINTVESPIYTNFDYNFNLHIMEERYNVLTFSGGMARFMFTN